MADYNDYQLEDQEDAAVKNSQTAKRVLAGVGLAGVGAASAVAANAIINDSETPSDEQVSVEDLLDAAEDGAITDEALEPQEEEAPSAPEVHHYHEQPVVHETHVHVEPTTPAPEPEPHFDSTTYIYDEDGNIVSMVDQGSYDGSDFAVVDFDADGKGDLMMIDINKNGEFEEDEKIELTKDDNYVMGNGEHSVHVDINGNLLAYDDFHVEGDINQPFAQNPEDIYINEKNDIEDIENDFNDRTGEEYGNDLAQNNPDYNPQGDIEPYSASAHAPEYIPQDSDNNYASAEIYDGLPNPAALEAPYAEAEVEYVTEEPEDVSIDIDFAGADDDFVAEEPEDVSIDNDFASADDDFGGSDDSFDALG